MKTNGQKMPRSDLMTSVVLILLVVLSGCDDDSTSTSNRVDGGNPDVMVDTGGGDTTADTGGGDTSQDTGGEDTGGEDTGGEDTSDPGDTGDVDTCMCEDGKACVTNNLVTDACFDEDCPDTDCGDAEVCVQGECTPIDCAGIYCGEYPNACVEGECVTVSCADPGVSCPDGLTCLGDECLRGCADNDVCAPQACLGGFCRPCEEGADQCDADDRCVAGECLASCASDPDICTALERCDVDLEVCIPLCTSDPDCGDDEICEMATGECVAAECLTPGEQGVCAEGEICLRGRCSARNPSFLGNLCSGAQIMASQNYRAVSVLSPVEQTGSVSTSSQYKLQSGSVTIILSEP